MCRLLTQKEILYNNSMTKYPTEELIADTFMEVLDDLSDKHLEALKEAFDSGPIVNPQAVIRMMYKEVLSQIRYRAQEGVE